jgi:hypothetical protein
LQVAVAAQVDFKKQEQQELAVQAVVEMVVLLQIKHNRRE